VIQPEMEWEPLGLAPVFGQLDRNRSRLLDARTRNDPRAACTRVVVLEGAV